MSWDWFGLPNPVCVQWFRVEGAQAVGSSWMVALLYTIDVRDVHVPQLSLGGAPNQNRHVTSGGKLAGRTHTRHDAGGATCQM